MEWMKTYLTGRRQCVQINGICSDKVTLQYGFPQGSCIGPFGFKLYTKSLTQIAKHHKDKDKNKDKDVFIGPKEFVSHIMMTQTKDRLYHQLK